MIRNKAGVCLCMLLIFLLMLPGLGIPAAEGENANTRGTTILTERFYSFDQYTTWNYEFSDDFFFLPSDTYNHSFARLSLGVALAAFRDTSSAVDQGKCLIQFLGDAGFEDIDAHTYDTNPTGDSIGLGIGHKKVDSVTVIALAVCGGNYGPEWASNVKIGDEELSQGFAESAEKVLGELDTYRELPTTCSREVGASYA
ncbi:MAG: hypothetical protein IJ088_13310 [Clostridia bacterium]|nr:hypothetical protein [Clostridia bacterium]